MGGGGKEKGGIKGVEVENKIIIIIWLPGWKIYLHKYIYIYVW